MKKYNLTKYTDSNSLLKTTPQKKHYDKVIKEDTAFYLDGLCIGIYINVDKNVLSYVRNFM